MVRTISEGYAELFLTRRFPSTTTKGSPVAGWPRFRFAAFERRLRFGCNVTLTFLTFFIRRVSNPVDKYTSQSLLDTLILLNI